AWIGERFKLYRGGGSAKFNLFDLVADPSEKTDLAKRQPGLAKRFVGELAAWRASCRASAAGEDY
ncbi:MAG: N-acetylgalactosamine 6-sulfate sulfatase, partial [Verrucomicrobiota bacterium]|nr:N-acetylgalactosamine 6-sulfate sulfatase [Verrucomicrobiota bacterium]